MYDLKNEISREPLNKERVLTVANGEPILYAFDCALLEKHTDTGTVYTIQNLTTGRLDVIARRKFPMYASGVEAMVERIRKSPISGAGRYEADRPVREQISLTKAREILHAVFKELLPQHGYAVRKEQVELALHILNEIANHRVTLAEAEVGTGKTLAYLVAAIIAKRGRLNDFYNTGLYPVMPYYLMYKMPIVIATSSIALQRAILTEHIPTISRVLLKNRVINTPVTAALRKGKEHYACESKLRAHIPYENHSGTKKKLERLLDSNNKDLAETDLASHIKKKIAVTGRCYKTCPHRETCQYQFLMGQVISPDIDIQVCNHNYLLADSMLRAEDKQPLIPNYQILIIDEAHKYSQAAQDMYGSLIADDTALEVHSTIFARSFMRQGYRNLARETARMLKDDSAKLFDSLLKGSRRISGDDATRYSVNMDDDTAKKLHGIRDIADRLSFILRDEAIFVKASGLLTAICGKYGADTKQINIRQIFAGTSYQCESHDEQRKIMLAQLTKFYQELCALPEIKEAAVIAIEQRKLRQSGSSPERDALRNEESPVLTSIWKKVERLLPTEKPNGRTEWITTLIRDLEQLADQADNIALHSELICWIETGGDGINRLRAIPKDLGKWLYDDQWKKGVPTVLTSGTLSTKGDFSHVKRELGLERLENRLSEVSKASPFDYMKNAMLYISETMPFPDKNSATYMECLTNEVESLIRASHGRAAVLFTSYRAMDMVCGALKKRKLPFPMFKLGKGSVCEIEKFKQSGNGVLFASGALWEGIDIPGDALSMLIIVKLPFAVPDPINEYERSRYSSEREFKRRVIIPAMLIKLKQGFGRLIRTMKDSGVVAILDCRANSNGIYHFPVVEALPKCEITSDVQDVDGFLRRVKPDEYFEMSDCHIN